MSEKLMARPWEPQDLLDALQGLIDEEPEYYTHETLCMARDYLREHFNIEGLPPKGKKGDSTMNTEMENTMEQVESTETVEATEVTTEKAQEAVEITINGVVYVKKDAAEKDAKEIARVMGVMQEADQRRIEELEIALEDQAEMIDELRDAKEMKAAEELAGMKYCIVWGKHSGIWAGYVEEDDGEYVKLRRARYIQQLSGACGLNQFAKYGTKEPQNCQITVEVDNARITDATIIIECTETARQNILRIPDWKV